MQSAEAGRYGGEASPETHQVPAAAEEHPEEDGRAGDTRRPQQHGEGSEHFRSACWVGFPFLDLMESPSAVHQRSHGCTCSIYQTSVSPLHQVAVVEGFINSVDSQMRLRQEQQKLATVSARIDSYEAVEGSSEEVEKVVLVPFGSNQCSVRRSLTSAASSSDP